MASGALFKLPARVRLKAWKFTSLPIRKPSFAKPAGQPPGFRRMRHFLSPEASAELDGIWEFTAIKSGSIEIADRLVDTMTEHFYLIASHPGLAASATSCGGDIAAFPLGHM